MSYIRFSLLFLMLCLALQITHSSAAEPCHELLKTKIIEQFQDQEPVSLIFVNETSQTGLSGNLVFVVLNEHKEKLAVVKAFTGLRRDNHLAEEINGIQKTGHLKVLFTFETKDHQLLGMSAAQGVEMRTVMQNLALEDAEKNPEKFSESLKLSEEIGFALGKELATLHLQKQSFTTVHELKNHFYRVIKKAELAFELLDARGQAPVSREKFEELKIEFLNSTVEIGTIHGDANAGNFFYEAATKKITMIDLGKVREDGFTEYEYLQVLASLRLLQLQSHLDQNAVALVIESFQQGYDSIRKFVGRTEFLKLLWFMRSEVSRLELSPGINP